ncbi:unnamed protein product [Lathyrus oleraceus]|uniref:Uncharacterized protein n=1 Tax=Pisum sativum TaxID=3888 RepID=A0A9D5B205_PEA|nr:hypothetical protein KIW84_032266 [Pisum sativum]
MEKNNKTSSNFSICRKIRQVLATNLAFKTVVRMKQQNQEPKPQQQMKIVNIEGESGGGTIPITFDYSMVTEHTSKIDSPRVGISERKGKMIGENYNGKPLKVGLVNLEKQGNKSLAINDAFIEFIERTNNKVGTVSNVGKGQKNHVQDEDNSFNKIENLNDRFSEFIMEAKKRISTT